MRRCLGTLICLMTLGASAETYQAWLHDVGRTNTAFAVQFQPWGGFTNANATWGHFARGGYEGDLVLRASSGNALRPPLRVRLLFNTAAKADVSGLPESSNLWYSDDRFAVHLRLERSIRERLFLHDVTVSSVAAGQSVSVPFVFPRTTATRMEPFLVVGRYEVTDADGVVLARGLAPRLLVNTPRYGCESTAWVTDDPESDRLLREHAHISNAETVTVLPDVTAAYDGLSAIWVSHDAWQVLRGDLGFWRRILLQGVSLYARTNTLDAMRAALHVSADGSVLRAGVYGADQALGAGNGSQAINSLDLHTTVDAHGSCDLGSLLENNQPLFVSALSYQAWTAAILGLFTLGTVALLVLAFVRLKGAKRVRLWWIIPVWSVGFSLVGGLGGRLVLSRQPRADVTEYRFARTDWPEMYCLAAGRSLHFSASEQGWRMPADATLLQSGSPSSESRAGDAAWLQSQAAATVLHVETGDRGVLHDDNAGWFRPCTLPFGLAPQDGLMRIRATEDLDAVFVWREGVWHTLGAVRAGQTSGPCIASKKGLSHHLAGLPSAVADRLTTGEPPCGANKQDARMAKEDDRPWLVVALQRRPGDLKPLNPRSAFSGRIIWVVQAPVEATALPMRPRSP